MKKIVKILIILALIIGAYNYRVKIKDFFVSQPGPSIVTTSRDEILPIEQELITVEPSNTTDEVVMPQEFNLVVPFIVQAPTGNWDLPYQEACEEAAIIMLHYYWQGNDLATELADQEINNLVNWQNENRGDYKDTTIEQTAKIVEDYWGYETEIINNPSPGIIKEKIFQGYPIVAPFYGQGLGNPYYSGEGPLYHMMVIKGYSEDKFITNDPGTRRGADYVYDIEIIMSAMHDWNDGQVATGAARILIIKP